MRARSTTFNGFFISSIAGGQQIFLSAILLKGVCGSCWGSKSREDHIVKVRSWTHFRIPISELNPLLNNIILSEGFVVSDSSWVVEKRPSFSTEIPKRSAHHAAHLETHSRRCRVSYHRQNFKVERLTVGWDRSVVGQTICGQYLSKVWNRGGSRWRWHFYNYSN